jgi:hypothetical protein
LESIGQFEIQTGPIAQTEARAACGAAGQNVIELA